MRAPVMTKSWATSPQQEKKPCTCPSGVTPNVPARAPLSPPPLSEPVTLPSAPNVTVAAYAMMLLPFTLALGVASWKNDQVPARSAVESDCACARAPKPSVSDTSNASTSPMGRQQRAALTGRILLVSSAATGAEGTSAAGRRWSHHHGGTPSDVAR